MYFKNLKKKRETSFRRTTNYIYAHSHTSHPFFLFLLFRSQIHAKRTLTLLSSWKRLLESVVSYSLQRSAILYARSTYLSSILSCPRTLHPFLSHSRSFHLSTKSIYLITFLVVHSSFFFRQYSNAFMVLRYIHLSWRARGERERDAGPIKKIITRFRGTSSSPNFDAPRSRRRTGVMSTFLSFLFFFFF